MSNLACGYLRDPDTQSICNGLLLPALDWTTSPRLCNKREIHKITKIMTKLNLLKIINLYSTSQGLHLCVFWPCFQCSM